MSTSAPESTGLREGVHEGRQHERGPRVLHVMRMKGASGSENHLVTLCHGLADEGWISDVLIPTPDARLVKAVASGLQPVCDRVDTFQMGQDFSPGLVRELAARLRTGRYDVVHSHLVHADWHLALASLRTPHPPLVSTKHNHDPFRTRLPVRWIERSFARRYSATIAISNDLSAFTANWTGVKPTAVHYGLPAGDAEAPPARTGDRLLAVGRLEPQKGHDVLIKALPQIAASVPTVSLTIAGEGSQRKALVDLATRLGVTERVTLVGESEDVTELMREATVLVHPSRWEGFGLVLLEAMRERLPIVATAVGAIPEVVLDGTTGRVVVADDPDALARGVLDILHTPDSGRLLGEAGYSRLRTVFSPKRMVRETVSVYEAVTALSRAT